MDGFQGKILFLETIDFPMKIMGLSGKLPLKHKWVV